MPAPGQPDSGPAGVYTLRYPGGHASPFSKPPPKYTHHQSNIVVAERTTSVEYIAERRPLLPQPKRDAQPKATRFSLLAILCIVFLFCQLLYFIIPGRSDTVDYKSLYEVAATRIQHLTANNLALGKEVTLYKDMYEDVRVRAVHLEQENAALEGEVHDMQTKLHDLREHLTNAKALAFWEIVRTMYTNMDVWVGADDPGGGPKFWSYGITSGLFNDNDPPVSSTKFHFADYQAAIIESTEQRRIVGYKVESNRWNNGWWIATGLIEFGQSGSHEVKFGAKAANNGAEYDVTVFYADWKP